MDFPSPQRRSGAFEGVLEEVEQCVAESARAMLFTGRDLRLEITLTRKDGGSRVAWGLKGHEDWAFKATILRFIHGSDPVHLILEDGGECAQGLHGWVVGRSRDGVWASPLSLEQARNFFNRLG